ncbi:MAG: SpoIIE family protein phosphatase [bacterium]|nr:SpoIIE family protein phosphatase [bacterium]
MKRKLLLLVVSALPAVVGLILWATQVDLGFFGLLVRAYAVIFLAVWLLWLIARGLRLFLWRVGRRLAFSYFLIGVLPILTVASLILVASYIASGFLLGHLYRDAVHSVASELRFAASSRLEQLSHASVSRTPPPIHVVFGYYRDGFKIAGPEEAPAHWQSWWADETIETAAPAPVGVPFVALADGSPTLMAAASEGRYGILALFAGNLDRELSERSGVWVELERSDEEQRDQETSITVLNREYCFKPPQPDGERTELRDFFHPGIDSPSFLDRPSFLWVEISQPFLDLETGSYAADHVAAALTGSLRTLAFHLNSRAARINLFAYSTLFALAILLFEIWVLAAVMALVMIFGLSRAVNRLSRVTRKVQDGDFSARIEVRRKDQLGVLQSSFNQMSESLETLIASAAQKEVLENELSIARELQQSLLPDELEGDERLSFATYFAPSAAIGGDYYDLLPMAGDRLAVVVADVSGHGLSAGLRMAMVKSALQLLCEQECRPEEILLRLHRLQLDGSGGNRRGFVTATLSLIDSASGELVVTNAGHPPTYLLRGGQVIEITLPSSPLGGLGSDFGQQSFQLEPNDVVVWLSDGLIEAVDAHQEPFGYERILTSLERLAPDATSVRDHLLAAIDQHTGGGPPDDDRTLVVMTYRPPEPSSGDSAPESAPSLSPSSA